MGCSSPASRGAGGAAGRRTVARRTALVEDDLPPAVAPAAPDRVEGADALPARIAHRPAAEGDRTRVEDLDVLGLPGERGLRALVEPLPAFRDLLPAAEDAVPSPEDRLRGDEGGERRVIAVGHGLGERALGVA